jgi:hypothetical protein
LGTKPTHFKGGFILRDDGMLPGSFVFPSLTQKAADKNRSSQKPPAVWIGARTYGKWYRLQTLAKLCVPFATFLPFVAFTPVSPADPPWVRVGKRRESG